MPGWMGRWMEEQSEGGGREGGVSMGMDGQRDGKVCEVHPFHPVFRLLPCSHLAGRPPQARLARQQRPYGEL